MLKWIPKLDSFLGSILVDPGSTSHHWGWLSLFQGLLGKQLGAVDTIQDEPGPVERWAFQGSSTGSYHARIHWFEHAILRRCGLFLLRPPQLHCCKTRARESFLVMLRVCSVPKLCFGVHMGEPNHFCHAYMSDSSSNPVEKPGVAVRKFNSSLEDMGSLARRTLRY